MNCFSLCFFKFVLTTQIAPDLPNALENEENPIDIELILKRIQAELGKHVLYIRYNEYLYMHPVRIKKSNEAELRTIIEYKIEEAVMPFIISASDEIVKVCEAEEDSDNLDEKFTNTLNSHWTKYICNPNKNWLKSFREGCEFMESFNCLMKKKIFYYFYNLFVLRERTEKIQKCVCKIIIRAAISAKVQSAYGYYRRKQKTIKGYYFYQHYKSLKLTCDDSKDKIINEIYEKFEEEINYVNFINHAYEKAEQIDKVKDTLERLLNIIVDLTIRQNGKYKQFEAYGYEELRKYKNEYLIVLKYVLEFEEAYDILIGIIKLASDKEEYDYLIRVFIETVLFVSLDEIVDLNRTCGWFSVDLVSLVDQTNENNDL